MGIASIMKRLIETQGDEVRLFTVEDRTAGINAVLVRREGYQLRYREPTAVAALGQKAPECCIRLRAVKAVASLKPDGK